MLKRIAKENLLSAMSDWLGVVLVESFRNLAEEFGFSRFEEVE